MMLEHEPIMKTAHGLHNYKVTDRGEVLLCRVQYESGATEQGFRDREGCRWVILYNYRGRWIMPVARLVLVSFNGTAPDSRHQPHHIDGDPTNDCLSNLEWRVPPKPAQQTDLTPKQLEQLHRTHTEKAAVRRERLERRAAAVVKFKQKKRGKQCRG